MEGLRGREIRFMDILDIDDQGIQIIKDTSRSKNISRAATPEKRRRDSVDPLDSIVPSKVEPIFKTQQEKEASKMSLDSLGASEENDKKPDKSLIMAKIANAQKMLHKVASKFKNSIKSQEGLQQPISEKIDPSERTSVDSRRSKPEKTFKTMLKDLVEEGSSSRRRKTKDSLDSRSVDKASLLAEAEQSQPQISALTGSEIKITNLFSSPGSNTLNDSAQIEQEINEAIFDDF